MKCINKISFCCYTNVLSPSNRFKASVKHTYCVYKPDYFPNVAFFNSISNVTLNPAKTYF